MCIYAASLPPCDPTQEEGPTLGSRALLVVTVALHAVATLCACSAAAAAAPTAPVTLLLIMAYSVSISAVAGFCSAHELLHSRHPLHQVAGDLFYALVLLHPYMM